MYDQMFEFLKGSSRLTKSSIVDQCKINVDFNTIDQR